MREAATVTARDEGDNKTSREKQSLSRSRKRGKKCEEYEKDRHQWEMEGLKEADAKRNRPEVLLRDETK